MKEKKFNSIDYVVLYLLALYIIPVPTILILTVFPRSREHDILGGALTSIGFFAFYIPIWYAFAKFTLKKK